MEQVDKEIIKGLQSGDQQAYGVLIRLYFQPLTVYAKSILVDFEQSKDIVQEVFMKLWNMRQSLDISISLKSYLYRTVHNACIDYLRKERSKNTIKTLSYDDIHLRLNIFDIKEDEHFFDLLFSDEMEGLLQRAIDQLPLQCKEIFLLSRYEQLSYSEISEQLSISVSTVKTQMVRAMQKIKEFMQTYLK